MPIRLSPDASRPLTRGPDSTTGRPPPDAVPPDTLPHDAPTPNDLPTRLTRFATITLWNPDAAEELRSDAHEAARDAAGDARRAFALFHSRLSRAAGHGTLTSAEPEAPGRPHQNTAPPCEVARLVARTLPPRVTLRRGENWAALPANLRCALYLVRAEGFSIAEGAHVTGAPKAVFRNRLRRARVLLGDTTPEVLRQEDQP